MDKKLARIMEPGMKLNFCVLVLFALASMLFSVWVGAAELVLVVLVYVFYKNRTKKRSAEIRRYVENLAFQVDDVSKHSLVNFPLPTTILRLDTGEVIWYNDGFIEMTGAHEGFFDMHISDAVPGFDTRWVMEGRAVCPYDVSVGERKFTVYGNVVRAAGKSGARSLLATLFWVDITEFARLRDEHERSRPVVALVMLDSYEELFKGLTESEKSMLTASVDKMLSEWTSPTNGIMRRLDRDKYLFIFENHNLLDLVQDKFSIIEKMHQIQNSEGIAATLSIGIGKGEYTLYELYQFASLGLDMALSRGGDQVVIKSKNAFEFYGGRSRELEKRTKVKSRVMANALRQLIRDSSQVFVMGHRFSDLDCIGAAAGVCAAVRKCGKPYYLLVDAEKTAALSLVRQMKQQPEYQDSFLTEDEAILRADGSSLLIVVDTSRPDIVESEKLLQTVQRVAVIDHHRRAANYIENSAISMHEPYASSASELVAELLQYIVTPQDVTRLEAEAVLAGIVLDTKSFTVKTGVRTFEAAAYLKQLGADTVEVRKLFSGDLESFVKKCQLIAGAHEFAPGVSLSVTSDEVERAVASQAADELINLKGIRAAIVVYGEGEGTSVSARSYGQINVQFVMEKIGGGGSMNMAGAQFADKKPPEVSELVKKAVLEYLAEIEEQDKKAAQEGKNGAKGGAR